MLFRSAGGLVGNFTGEPDFLFQREVLAANPKIYGQLVTLLAPFSKAIKQEDGGDGAAASPATTGTPSPVSALALAMASGIAPEAVADAPAEPAPAVPAAPVERERKPVRIKKLDLPAAAPAADARRGDDRRPPRPGPRPEGRGDFRSQDRGPAKPRR